MNAYLLPIEIQEKIIEFLPLDSQLNLSRHLVNNKIDSRILNWNSDELSELSENSLLKYIKCVLLKKFDIDVNIVFKIACNSNYLKVVKYISNLMLTNGGRKGNIFKSFDIVIRRGHLEIFKCLCESFYKILTESILNHFLGLAIGNNKIQVVKYLVCVKDVSCNFRDFTKAARLGHTTILKFLVENNTLDEKVISRCLETAAWKGHLDIIKYLTKTINFKHDYRVLNGIAASQGHTEITDYLRK